MKSTGSEEITLKTPGVFKVTKNAVWGQQKERTTYIFSFSNAMQMLCHSRSDAGLHEILQ